MTDVKLGRLLAVLALDSKQFKKELSDTDRAVFNYGKKLESVGKGLTTHLTLPLAAIGAAVTKLGVDFDTSMTKIETLVGVNRKTVDLWRKDILALAPAVGKGPTELADAMFAVTSAGARGSKALEILERSAKASAIGLGDTLDVSLALTSSLAAFERQGLTAERAVDVLVTTVRAGNLEAEGLASSLGNVIPVASAAGVTFDQLGAAIATVSRVTPVAQAVTQVAAAIKQLNAPTAESIPLIKEAFGSLENARAQLQSGLLPTFRQLVEQFGSSPEVLRKLLGSSEALNAVLSITSQNAAEVDAIFADVANSTGALDEAFLRTTETAKFAMDQMVAALKVAGVELANSGVIDFVDELSREITELAKEFSDLPRSTKEASVAFAAIVIAVGPVLTALGLLAGAVGLVGIGYAALGAGTATLIGYLASLAIEYGHIERVTDSTREAVENLANANDESAASARAAANAQLEFARASLAAAEEAFEAREVSLFDKIGSLITTGGTADLGADVERERIDALRKTVSALESALAATEPAASAAAGAVGEVGTAAEAVRRQIASLTAGEGIAGIFAKAGDALDLVGVKAEVLGERFDPLAEKASILERAIIGILDVEGGRTSEELAKLSEQLKAVDSAIEAAERAADLQAKATREAERELRKAERAATQFHKILKDTDTAARQVNMDPLVAEFERTRNELIELGKAAGLTSDELAAFIAEWERDFGVANQNVVIDLRESLLDLANWVIPNLAASFGGFFSNIKTQGLGSFKTLATQVVQIFKGAGSQIQTIFGSLLQGTNLQTAINGISTIANAFSGGGGVSGTVNRLVNSFSGQTSSAIADENPTTTPGGQITPNTPAPLIGKTLGTIAGAVLSYIYGVPGGSQIGGALGESFGELANNAAARASKSEVIGAAIGAVIDPMQTFLLGAFLGKFKKIEGKIALLTSSVDNVFEDGGSNDGAPGVKTPFGFVGIHGDRSKNLNRDLRDYVMEQVALFDEVISSALTPEEIERAAAGLQSNRPLQFKFTKFNNEMAKILTDRMRSLIEVFAGHEVADEVLKEFGRIKKDPRLEDLQDLIDTGIQFFEERSRLVKLRDDLFNDTLQPITQAEQAISELNAAFNFLTSEAEKFGVSLDGIGDAYDRQRRNLTADFDDDIAQAILGFTDPLQAALNELADQQAARVREAEVYGADLVQLERLSALERIAIMEQFNDATEQASNSIRDLLLSLTATTASPLSPIDVLSAAEERFAAARSAFGAGAGDPSELTAAASALIDASEAVFASSEMFFQRFDFVVSSLQNILSGVPGFAHGGSFTVGGTGGTDSVIPLFRATPGETVTVSKPGDRSENAAAIASIQASAEQTDLLTEIATGLRRLGDRMDTQQAALVRFASKAAGAR